MDDDWLDDDAPRQGGSADPLTSREYDRLASRYSDVSTSAPTFAQSYLNWLHLNDMGRQVSSS